MFTNKFTFVEQTEKTVVERKKELRAFMKRRRSENENRDIKERLMTDAFLRETANKERFFIYLSFSSEASTERLIETLLAMQKKVFCPRVIGNEMVAVEYGEDFTLSDYGIREPVGEAYTGELDVIVTPLLAADIKGGRLGYGGGYYDRFLKVHPEALRVGWCYDFQIAKNVPVDERDEPLDLIVTDERCIRTKKTNKGEI